MSHAVKLIVVCAALPLLSGPVRAAEERPAAPAQSSSPAPDASKPAALPPGHPPMPGPAGAAPAPAAPATVKGVVVETMNAGGYTYLCVEGGGQKRWAAIRPTEVKVGQEVEVGPGIEMRNFTSKSLGRTFESIVFSGGLVKPKGDAASAGAAAPTGRFAGHPEPAAEQPNRSVAGKVVEMLEGGGYTYAAVEKDGRRTWVAVPRTKLEVGQEVQFTPGMVMKQFASKALNRTFDSIVFSSGLAPRK